MRSFSFAMRAPKYSRHSLSVRAALSSAALMFLISTISILPCDANQFHDRLEFEISIARDTLSRIFDACDLHLALFALFDHLRISHKTVGAAYPMDLDIGNLQKCGHYSLRSSTRIRTVISSAAAAIAALS